VIDIYSKRFIASRILATEHFECLCSNRYDTARHGTHESKTGKWNLKQETSRNGIRSKNM